MPTALIAEDEPLLAAALAAELAQAWPELEIVVSVGDGLSAVRETLACRPDVLFFDIRMPGLSGLEAAAELTDAWNDTAMGPFPLLAFVTAYDQYAVQAFEAQALDYVLKPVQSARLLKTVQKLRAALAQRARSGPGPGAAPGDALQASADQLRLLLERLQAGSRSAQPLLQHLPVNPAGTDGNITRLVPVAEVLFLQAADKYVRVVTPQGEHLVRTPLKDLLGQLDTSRFWQIHRNAVVRADAIDSVQRDEAGRLHLVLRDHPERLAVSRLYAHRFKAL